MKRTVLIVYLFLFGAHFIVAQETKIRPKEVYVLMVDAVNNNISGAKRIDVTKPFLKRVDTTFKNREDKFYLAEIYFWNFDPKNSAKLYSELKDGSDYISRASWQRLFLINSRAFKKFDDLKIDIEAYRKKFALDPKDKNGTSWGALGLAQFYNKDEKHRDVVEIIERELAYINFEGPYNGFRLPGMFFKSFKEEGKDRYIIDLLEKSIMGLNLEMNKLKNNLSDNQPDFVRHSKRVKGMLTVATTRHSEKTIIDDYEKLLQNLKKDLKKMRED